MDIDGAGNKTFYYYLCDQVGSVLQVVKADGTVVSQYDYDAFGNIRPENTYETVENRYTFQGREWDAHAGHYYFRNRTYVPEWGSFTGPDMDLSRGIVGEANGVGSYLALGNNPLDVRDPRGMQGTDPYQEVYRYATEPGNPALAEQVVKMLQQDPAAVRAMLNPEAIRNAQATVLERQPTQEQKEKFWVYFNIALLLGGEAERLAGWGVDIAEAVFARAGARVVAREAIAMRPAVAAAARTAGEAETLGIGATDEATILRLASQSERARITVIGSIEHTSRHIGREGFNVLNVPESVYKGMTGPEFDRLNAEWLNEALQRGDTIWIVTDPAKHALRLESIRPGLSLQSRFLNLELPMLEEFGAIIPRMPSTEMPIPVGFTP